MTTPQDLTATETAQDVLERVRRLVPLLRANAGEAEARREVPAENIDALDEAGVFRLPLPTLRGGLQASMAAQNEVLAEIARGCPSTGWVCTLILAVNWTVNLFPDEAQEDLYATPSLRCAGVLAPTGKGHRTDGGVLVSGRWGFNTGSANAQWAVLTAMVEDSERHVAPHMLLIPYAELESDDDWHPCGLAGTGSRSTIATNVFVPDHRVLSLQNFLAADYSGSTLAAKDPYFQQYGSTVFLAGSAGAPVGIARGAMDVFMDRLPGRGITYTAYDSQSEAPITHHQVAEATLKLFSAEAHMHRVSALIDGRDGELLSLGDRAAIRGHLGHLTRLSREVVQTLFEASGASAIQHDVPIQRYHRDIQSLSLHGLLQPNTNTELYGRVLLGLDPATSML